MRFNLISIWVGCSEICTPPFCCGAHFGLMIIAIINNCIVISNKSIFLMSAKSELGKWFKIYLQDLIRDKHRDR